MALFFNESGVIAAFITQMTNNVTGSLFLSLLIIMVFFMLAALLFRLPIEFAAIILMPVLIVFMAATSDFLAVGGVFLIYLGVIFAKNFFLK